MVARDSDQYMLRLPDGLRDRLKAMADANGRSLNSEIVALIERGLGDGDRLAQLERRVTMLERKDAIFGDYLARVNSR